MNNVGTRPRRDGARRDLRAWAIAEVRAFGERPPSYFRCADPSGTIRVTLRADDRMVDVDLDPDWRDRFGPEYFDTALLAAYRGALHDCRYVRGLVQLAAGNVGGSGASSLEGRAGAAIDVAVAAAGESGPVPAGCADSVVRSPAGYLRLVRRGGSIRSAHADTRRIGAAPAPLLCHDVLAVFQLALGA
ncbi:hypothetical protein [Actinocatenispora thailandica]|uniref:hypothetical protein n=1 Tax=Actinocatenispora thailandica TaxID=227318 RepID=UPI00194F1F87|nr:hypothetical protein [Actinocatenispora thailandica]